MELKQQLILRLTEEEKKDIEKVRNILQKMKDFRRDDVDEDEILCLNDRETFLIDLDTTLENLNDIQYSDYFILFETPSE